ERRVVDMMDETRRDPAEVRHQSHIIDIALPDVPEREGGGVRAREALGEVGEATVHCRTADIEKLRLREYLPQEHDVAPIVRELVDEIALCGLAMEGGAAEIVLPYRRCLVGL